MKITNPTVFLKDGELFCLTVEVPKEPKHEAIEDTFIDAACYGVIGLLVRRGVWGK